MRILTQQVNPSDIINRRVDIVFFSCSKNSVMNGDPDNEGRQRIDPVTGKALTTPVSIKSWIRSMAKLEGKAVYIDRGGLPLATILNEVSSLVEETAPAPELAADAEPAKGKGKGKAKPKKVAKDNKAEIVDVLSSRYIDIRWFGGALTAPVNEQITGPIQFTFGESIDQVSAMDFTITRGCVTKEEDEAKERTMGTMPSMAFALFRQSIHVNPFCARRVKATWNDLDDMLYYLINSYDQFKSTIRSNNNFVKMVVFVHPDENGKEACSKLLQRVVVSPVFSGTRESGSLPTSLDDYDISVKEDGLKEKGFDVQVVTPM
jgi:CRISPR-associated protein Csd2